MKLISMTDFVINESTNKQVSKNFSGFTDIVNNKKLSYDNIISYANFLKQPLTLGMFVPCDENGNVLSEKYSAKEDAENKSFTKLSNEYQQAKERCLFEGFKVMSQDLYDNYFELELHGKDFWITFVNNECQIEEDFEIENIEHLLMNSLEDLELTQTTIKQIGL